MLDIRTIFIGYTISAAICAVVVAFLWRQNRRRYPGLGFWLANFVMQSVAVLLITLRGVVPDFISIVVANFLAVAGTILLYIGLEYFINKVSSQRHNYIVLVIFFFIHTYFTYLQPSLTARNHNFSFATLFVCIQIAWLMLHRVDAKFRPDAYRIGFIFVAFGLVNIFRILLETNLSTNDFFQSGTLNALATLVYQMLYISLTFTLFLILNHRLVVELERDITERKRTEQALSENHSTLRNILESTDALIFSLNRQYCYTSFNSAHAAKIKEIYNQNIQIGGNLLEYMTDENDRLIAKQNIDRSLAGERLVEESFSGDKALSRLYFEVSHAPIITNAGEIIGVSIFSKDITNRKQIELSLQLRLMELETVSKLSISLRAGKNLEELLYILLRETLKTVNTTDGCILLLDPVDNLLKLTESKGWFEPMTNLSLNITEGIVGHVFATNDPYISLDTQNDKLISDQIRTFTPTHSSGAFLPIRGENGIIGLIIISFHLPRIISENEVRLLTIISQLAANAITRSRLQDQIQSFNLDLQNEIHKKIVIQELLAAEKELLSTTLMSIADGVIVTDKDGLVILFNQAAETITGYILSEAIKKPVNNVFRLHISNTFEMVPDVIKYLFELEDAQKNHVAYQSPMIVSKTGERILLSGNITSLKSADLEEDTVGFVFVFQNINEKLKTEAQNMLSQKMEAIGQLATGIAHEINTPIQYVGDNIKFLGKAYLKYSEMLATYQQIIHERLEKPITQEDLDQLDELARQKKVSYYAVEIPRAIQESLDGTERVRKIVLAMREFSHPSEKEKKLSDINHGIETTIVISRNEWKYCAELETDLDDELPLVYCQIDEINQVILNMIVNAAQAIQEKLPQGSEQKGKILVSTRKHENKVLITVQDTGSGIPAEIRARIFDPFFTTKGVGKGTGQGLSMAHNIIVKKHQGIICVDSDPGVGTVFTIELPIDSSELEQR